ncbi:unnamed protein product, partial [Schistosoma curassoni]|uniref:IMD domain-containing protein n=1 Tax=Schistosoma curassoni TaxID=6186 RepID=A0A183JME3_9TREM
MRALSPISSLIAELVSTKGQLSLGFGLTLLKTRYKE